MLKKQKAKTKHSQFLIQSFDMIISLNGRNDDKFTYILLVQLQKRLVLLVSSGEWG